MQVAQNALRQLDNLLVPVRLGHLRQRRVEDRQNDGNVVADQCRDVLIAPERQHSLGHLPTTDQLYHHNQEQDASATARIIVA